MTQMEKDIVAFVNDMHRKYMYVPENYQLLHGIKYEKSMDQELQKKLINRYQHSSGKAAYELKTYYAENGILSNTIVLKMRPPRPDINEIFSICIPSELDGNKHEYPFHAIEIFCEDGKYKVFDVLHRRKVLFLENYLDELCKANNCERERLRYDMGLLASPHIKAGNMQELTDLLRYLDKKYKIGKPRFGMINTTSVNQTFFCSDEIFMDFDEFGRKYGVSSYETRTVFRRVLDSMYTIRNNCLMIKCHRMIARDIVSTMLVNQTILSDEFICKAIDGIGKE